MKTHRPVCFLSLFCELSNLVCRTEGSSPSGSHQRLPVEQAAGIGGKVKPAKHAALTRQKERSLPSVMNAIMIGYLKQKGSALHKETAEMH